MQLIMNFFFMCFNKKVREARRDEEGDTTVYLLVAVLVSLVHSYTKKYQRNRMMNIVALHLYYTFIKQLSVLDMLQQS